MIEPRDYHYVTGGEFGDEPAQLWPVRLGSARHSGDSLQATATGEMHYCGHCVEAVIGIAWTPNNETGYDTQAAS